MLKLHVPWESTGWNFYGVAVTEDPTRRRRRASPQVAAGGRAEIIILGAEVGIDASSSAISGRARGSTFDGHRRLRRLRRRRHPRGRRLQHVYKLPADRSHLPGARPDGTDGQHRRPPPPPPTASPLSRASRPRRSAASTTHASTTTTTCGRSAPSTSTTSPATPTLALPRPAVERRQRAAAELLLHGPALRGAVPVAAGALLLELHDLHAVDDGQSLRLSFVSRLDYSLTLLTHLSFEAFAASTSAAAAASSAWGSTCRPSTSSTERGRRRIRARPPVTTFRATARPAAAGSRRGAAPEDLRPASRPISSAAGSGTRPASTRRCGAGCRASSAARLWLPAQAASASMIRSRSVRARGPPPLAVGGQLRLSVRRPLSIGRCSCSSIGPVAQQHRALDDVLELADVARPAVRLQHARRSPAAACGGGPPQLAADLARRTSRPAAGSRRPRRAAAGSSA